MSRRIPLEAIAPFLGASEPLRDLTGEMSPRRRYPYVARGLAARRLANPLAQCPAPALLSHLDHRQAGLLGKTLQPLEQLSGPLPALDLKNVIRQTEREQPAVDVIHLCAKPVRD